MNDLPTKILRNTEKHYNRIITENVEYNGTIEHKFFMYTKTQLLLNDKNHDNIIISDQPKRTNQYRKAVSEVLAYR